MKITFAFIIAAAALLLPQSAIADDNNTLTQQEKAALESANWFVPISYGGFDFEIPAGSIVEKNSKLVVKYPDGSFGVSMENEAIAGDQKMAFEKAKMYARQYKLADSKCERVNAGGIKGARAEGMLEKHKVTVLILPVDDQQVTTVIMATPERSEWAQHFVNSMKR